MKNKNKIKIKINGKKLEVNQSSTVASIVKKLNIPLNKVAIELNREIINIFTKFLIYYEKKK